MTATHKCYHCGLWMDGMPGSGVAHAHCHDEHHYRAALSRVRALTALPSPSATRSPHTRRAIQRVRLERRLEQVTAEART